MGVPVTKKRNKGKKPASSRHTLRQASCSLWALAASSGFACGCNRTEPDFAAPAPPFRPVPHDWEPLAWCAGQTVGANCARCCFHAQMTGAEFFVEAEMAYFADNLHAARAGFQKALDIEPEVRRAVAGACTCDPCILPCVGRCTFIFFRVAGSACLVPCAAAERRISGRVRRLLGGVRPSQRGHHRAAAGLWAAARCWI